MVNLGACLTQSPSFHFSHCIPFSFSSHMKRIDIGFSPAAYQSFLYFVQMDSNLPWMARRLEIQRSFAFLMFLHFPFLPYLLFLVKFPSLPLAPTSLIGAFGAFPLTFQSFLQLFFAPPLLSLQTLKNFNWPCKFIILYKVTN
jgi:hypothetical protein